MFQPQHWWLFDNNFVINMKTEIISNRLTLYKADKTVDILLTMRRNLISLKRTFVRSTFYQKTMKLSHKTDKVFLCIKTVAFVACFVMFILLMVDIWEKFNSELTTIGIRLKKCVIFYYCFSSFYMKYGEVLW
jgi:hypothetical protein